MSNIAQNIYFFDEAADSKEELLVFLVVSKDDKLSEEYPEVMQYVKTARELLKTAERVIEKGQK